MGLCPQRHIPDYPCEQCREDRAVELRRKTAARWVEIDKVQRARISALETLRASANRRSDARRKELQRAKAKITQLEGDLEIARSRLRPNQSPSEGEF